MATMPLPTSRAVPPSRRRRLGRSIAIALAAGAAIHPVARLLARHDWRADLLTHFDLLALLASLVATIAALATRRRGAAVVLGTLALLQAWPIARLSIPVGNPAPDPSGDRLRLVVANVLWENEAYEPLRALIRAERPDLIGLVEVTDEWIDALESIRADYPYRIEAPGQAQGLALWSKRPWLDPAAAGVVRASPTDNPTARATIDLGGRALTVWLVHPPNPLAARGRGAGAAEIAALGDLVARGPGPKLVAGDLNRTDGSPLFGDFLGRTGLRDSRIGFGRQPSWPISSTYRIAIDHAFVTPDLAVIDRRLGPDVSSDHRPVIVDLAPATNPAAQGSQSGR